MRIAKAQVAQGKNALTYIQAGRKYLWFQDIAPGLPRSACLPISCFETMYERGQAGLQSLKDARQGGMPHGGSSRFRVWYDAQGVFFEPAANRHPKIVTFRTLPPGSIDLDIRRGI
jgi:hypothetical protein